MNINAEKILACLAKRHAADVFVPNCKTGQTNQGLLILDAWVMKKSWVNPLMIGYEIKVSRQDFLNDTKWQKYLPYCNKFYFVCPSKLIYPNELPPEAGLLYASQTGSRLYQKKPSIYRDVPFPASLAKYILMWRAKITNEIELISTKQYWEQWLKTKKEDREFGHMVSRKIREMVASEIDAVKKENARIKHENEKLQNVKLALEKLGLNIQSITYWSIEREIKHKLEIIKKGIPNEDLISYLDNVIYRLNWIKGVFLNEEKTRCSYCGTVSTTQRQGDVCHACWKGWMVKAKESKE